MRCFASCLAPLLAPPKVDLTLEDLPAELIFKILDAFNGKGLRKIAQLNGRWRALAAAAHKVTLEPAGEATLPADVLLPQAALRVGATLYVSDCSKTPLRACTAASGKVLWSIKRGTGDARLDDAYGLAVILRPRHPPAVCCADMHHNRILVLQRPSSRSIQVQQPTAVAVADDPRTLYCSCATHEICAISLTWDDATGECMGGAVVRRFGGDSLSDGPLTDANLGLRTPGKFKLPTGLCFAGGELFIADSMNSRIQVLDTFGRFLRQWSTVIEDRSRGPRFYQPFGICELGGLLYVTYISCKRIDVFTLEGELCATVGVPSALGPRHISVAGENVYVADNTRSAVHVLRRRVSPEQAAREVPVPFVRPAAAAVRSMPVTAVTTPRVSLSAPRANSAVPWSPASERGPWSPVSPAGSTGSRWPAVPVPDIE